MFIQKVILLSKKKLVQQNTMRWSNAWMLNALITFMLMENNEVESRFING